MLTIYFILVRPTLPENIGAAARALKTMGFSRLRLVSPCDWKSDRACWMAHRSEDILQKARVYADLASALRDIDFSIGTTCKHRIARRDYHACERVIDLIKSKQGVIKKAAIVFGSEKNGLSNDELSLCDTVSSIAQAQRQPSINLAQAVMIYAYELSALNSVYAPFRNPEKRDERQYAHLREEASRLLTDIGLGPGLIVHKLIMERIASLQAGDVRLAHSVCRAMRHAIASRAGHDAQPIHVKDLH